MPTGPTLTFDQVQALWIQNGGAPGWAPLAAAIAMAESGGNTVSLNNTPSTGDYSVGLWQINYYGSLGPSRTAEYGAPGTLQSDPNAQAKAAIQLSNNGADWGPWKTDAAWNAWQAHGAPATPSKATLSSWGVSLGGAGGASAASWADLNANAGVSLGTTGCGSKPPIFSFGGVAGIGSVSITACEGKAMAGGLCLAAGTGLALVGVLIIVAWGLGHTKAGAAAAGVVKGGGPVGMIAKAVA
jgi:hypothetical protein